jgi:hypothetical protein
MKYEYLKGSEKDFEGAPEWATHVIEHKEGNQRAFAEKFDYMCRAVYATDAELYPDSKTVIANPTMWIVIADRELVDVEVTGKSSWDGVGLPPVGCECEFISDTSWGRVKVIGYDGDKVVFKPSVDEYYAATPGGKCEFLPLRTEADKKRDAVIESLMRIVCGPSQASATVNKIYDAIAAGKIPGVKLED